MIGQGSPKGRLLTLRRRKDFLKMRLLSPTQPNIAHEVAEYYALEWAIQQLAPIHEKHVLGLVDRKPKLVPKND